MSPCPPYESFPELQTERLVLRRLRMADAPALLQVLSEPRVTRFYDLDPLATEAEARDLITRFQQRYSGQIGIRWAIARSETPQLLVGTCGYNIWWQSSRRGLLGYELHHRCWRQGMMSEALAAIMAFGYGQMDLNRIEAMVFAENQASRGLLEKLGFQPEGLLRQYEFIKGGFVDMVVYSRLRAECGS
jgi:[ribosomal protein S5]-alanine N-acetyltransferase